jgi:predicted DNA-binding ribbon-helix-helix protein
LLRLLCQYGAKGVFQLRHERVYSRRQRAVTFAGSTRTVTIPLEIGDFERLEQLAVEHNVGNATLVRQIIREYLKRRNAEPTPSNSNEIGSH